MNLRVTSSASGAVVRPVPALPVVALLAILSLRPAEAGLNTWTTSGPEADPILALAIDPRTPDTVYAVAGYSGVFKTTDGGESWSSINAGLEGFFAGDVAIDPSTPMGVYVAVQGGSGVYRSADGGATWNPVGPAIPPGVRSLAVDPVTPSTLYAAIGNRAFVTKTVDGGATWAVIAGFPDYTNDVAVDPVTPSTVYAATTLSTPTGGRLYKSVDGGLSWTGITSQLFDPNTGRRFDVLRVVIDPVDSAIVYIRTSGGGFKSTDGGAGWTPTQRAVTAIDPIVTTTVYAGAGTVYKSLDGGATFFPLNQGLPAGSVNDVAVDPLNSQIVYAGTGAGVFAIEQTPDTAAPEVALSAPASGDTVAGTINVSADATDDVAVAGVQFLLDGNPLGPEDTSSPFEVPWDTRTMSDGAHDLSARARDNANHATTSPTVTVIVANGPAPTQVLKRLEESAATLLPQGAWSISTSEAFGVSFSGGLAAHTQASGATATFTFKGTGVRWLGFPCGLCGVAEVFIDGARVATVDTFAPATPTATQVMYTSPRLTMRTHTLVVAVTGTPNMASAGTRIVVDAIEALVDGAGRGPGTP